MLINVLSKVTVGVACFILLLACFITFFSKLKSSRSKTLINTDISPNFNDLEKIYDLNNLKELELNINDKSIEVMNEGAEDNNVLNCKYKKMIINL